jgi:hypothetical protein
MSQQTRRRFLQAAGVGVTLPLLAGTAEAGDAPAGVDQSLLAIVRLRFKHLTEDQLKAVGRGILNGLASAETLKRVRLDPLDEPATVFVADVAE